MGQQEPRRLAGFVVHAMFNRKSPSVFCTGHRRQRVPGLLFAAKSLHPVAVLPTGCVTKQRASWQMVLEEAAASAKNQKLHVLLTREVVRTCNALPTVLSMRATVTKRASAMVRGQ